MEQTLDKVAAADLTGCISVAELAGREQWNPDRYAVALAENIRDSGMPLDLQRERLASLAQLGAGLAGDRASAAELARHFAILEALFHRFTRASSDAMDSHGSRGSEIADKYLSAALKAQRAAMACLSALKVLREGNQSLPLSPTMTPPGLSPATVELTAAKAT